MCVSLSGAVCVLRLCVVVVCLLSEQAEHPHSLLAANLVPYITLYHHQYSRLLSLFKIHR